MSHLTPVDAPALESLLGSAHRQLSDNERVTLVRWLSEPHFVDERPALESALRAARTDAAALADLRDAFCKLLPIGTGGRRAKVAPGPNRMNSVTLRESVYGLHCTMRDLAWSGAVIIGYDTRAQSRAFAHMAARLLLDLGADVQLLDAPRPTPQIAYWLRRLGCGAGIVISASHNPPTDNGIKMYGPDGAQVFAERDRALSQAILQQGPSAPRCAVQGWVEDHPQLARMDVLEADSGYAQEVLDQGVRPDLDLGACGPIVYTPLQGVGLPIVRDVLGRRGASLRPVPSQSDPGEGRFSATPATNPEEPAAFDAALELARQCGAKIVLANDPDADRLGACLWSERSARHVYVPGNQVCALLTDHVAAQSQPGDLVATTVVTTPLVGKIARHYGLTVVDDLLVGFKNHAALVETMPDRPLAFACEESLGYVRGRNIRDKDGAIAALLLCELLADLTRQGQNWESKLDALWRRHGVHVEHTENLRFEGQRGSETMREVMRTWREAPVTELGDFRRVAWEDRLALPPERTRDPVRGAPGNVLVGTFERGSTRANVVLRPSGTEPKLKLYILCHTEVDADDLEAVRQRVQSDQRALLERAKAKITASL